MVCELLSHQRRKCFHPKCTRSQQEQKSKKVYLDASLTQWARKTLLCTWATSKIIVVSCSLQSVRGQAVIIIIGNCIINTGLLSRCIFFHEFVLKNLSAMISDVAGICKVYLNNLHCAQSHFPGKEDSNDTHFVKMGPFITYQEV